MRIYKGILILLLTFHFICTFLVSIISLNLIDKKYSDVVYINTFFKQGWSFFAPDPVIGSTSVEYKCIDTEKINPWKSLEKGIKDLRAPWTTFLPSKNPGDLAENLGEFILDPSLVSNKFCSRGDCDQFKSEIAKNPEFIKLKVLIYKICKLEQGNDSGELVGDKIKVKYRNVRFFSERLASKSIYIDDLMELPTNEYN